MLRGVNDINVKMHLQEKLAFRIYKDYPLITLKGLVRNAIGAFGTWPLTIGGALWGYNFKDQLILSTCL